MEDKHLTLKHRFAFGTVIGVFFCFTLLVFGPLSLYVSGNDEMWFSFRSLMVPVIVVASAGMILMALGQDYASVDVHATLNMWNRVQPTIELGMGWGKTTPDGLNFTYHAKPSPYVKLGANYNFLFKSTPDHQAFVGVRAGFSTFKYDVDAHYSNSYWQEQTDFTLHGEHSHAWWGEVVAGLKVKIARQWSLGWTARWHYLFSSKDSEHSKAWYIPGYGPRGRALAFTVSAYYTLPLSLNRWPKITEKTTKKD